MSLDPDDVARLRDNTTWPLDRQDHRVRRAAKNASSMPAHGTIPFKLGHLLVVLLGMSLTGCWPTRAPTQWIAVINRTTAPYYPVLFQGCDVNITDVGFTISIRIQDASNPDTAAIAEIMGTFSVPWKDPKHGVASVKVIGVDGKEAIGTGNITGLDGHGEPDEFLIHVRASNAEQEAKEYVVAIKRFDSDH
jgi:hypothetical protein